MKNFYSLNKVCFDCGTKIANQNKRGYCRSCYVVLFRLNRKVQTAEYHKTKYINNKSEINAKIGLRYKTDINYKIKDILRRRIRTLIKDKKDRVSHVDNLGCSVQQLRQYLESKFQSGMTWDNQGRYGWHIDHIKPLSSFNLTDKEDLKRACHYTNLQPLWAEDNLRKSNK